MIVGDAAPYTCHLLCMCIPGRLHAFKLLASAQIVNSSNISNADLEGLVGRIAGGALPVLVTMQHRQMQSNTERPYFGM